MDNRRKSNTKRLISTEGPELTLWRVNQGTWPCTWHLKFEVSCNRRFESVLRVTPVLACTWPGYLVYSQFSPRSNHFDPLKAWSNVQLGRLSHKKQTNQQVNPHHVFWQCWSLVLVLLLLCIPHAHWILLSSSPQLVAWISIQEQLKYVNYFTGRPFLTYSLSWVLQWMSPFHHGSSRCKCSCPHLLFSNFATWVLKHLHLCQYSTFRFSTGLHHSSATRTGGAEPPI